MFRNLHIFLLGGFCILVFWGCKIEEEPERVLSLSIHVPQVVEPELCEYTDSVVIGLSTRDQYDRVWSDIAVTCSVGSDHGFNGFLVHTVFEGSTGSSGYVQFIFPVAYSASLGYFYALRAWAMGSSTIAPMTVMGVNEGPLGVTLVLDPDSLVLSQFPDSVRVRAYFSYDHGGPADETFTLHTEAGELADSILTVDNWLVETYWRLSESMTIGRHRITLEYSSSLCHDLFDTTWVTIIP